MASTYNEELEFLVCKRVLENGGGNFSVMDEIIEPSYFMWPSLPILWRAFEELHDDGVQINITTVSNHLDRTGNLEKMAMGSERGRNALKAILGLKEEVLTDAEPLAYQLREVAALRHLAIVANLIKEHVDDGLSPAEILAYADIELGKISTSAGVKSSNIQNAETVAEDLLKIFEDAVDGNGRYIETGLKAWDDFVGGLYPSRVYIVAGTSGSGKSTLVHNIIHWLSIVRDIMGGIFTLEMMNTEVAGRFIQMQTGISPISIEKGKVQDAGAFAIALKKIKKASLVYDESGELTLANLRSKIRKMKAMGVKYIVVDQLDMVQVGGFGHSSYSDGDLKTYKLKSYAKEFDIPIIVPHQLNKSTDNVVMRKNAFDVTLGDLKESGQNAVDGVVFVRRNKKREALVWVKARQGKMGEGAVRFNQSKTLYEDTNEYIPEEMQEDE